MASPPPPPNRPGLPLPGDVPLPEAIESDSDTAWELFREMERRQDAHFAETKPADDSIKDALRKSVDLFAGGQPPKKPAPLPGAITLDDALVEARRNNRVCPQPFFWQRLYDMIPGAEAAGVGAPLDGPYWRSSSSLAKRMVLRTQLEWAAGHGGLDAVLAFLRTLREEDWHHMGDE